MLPAKFPREFRGKFLQIHSRESIPIPAGTVGMEVTKLLYNALKLRHVSHPISDFCSKKSHGRKGSLCLYTGWHDGFQSLKE